MSNVHTLTPKPKGSTPSNGNGSGVAPPPPPPPELPLNLAGLADEVLAVLAKAVPIEIAERKAQREAEFFAVVREQAQLLGIAPARLAAVLARKPKPSLLGADSANQHDRRSEVAAKYQNPSNPSQTWSGRGQPPSWIELGTEINPKTGKPLPLAKFLIPANDPQAPGHRREP